MQEGGLKAHKNQVQITQICTRSLHSYLYFAHYYVTSLIIPLLPKATFTPSTQPNPDLSSTQTSICFRHQHPSSHMVLIHSPFSSCFQTISPLSDQLYLPAPYRFQLFHTSLHSQLNPFLSLVPNFSKLHFKTFTFLLLVLPTSIASAPYRSYGRIIIPSCRHFLTFIPSPLLLSTLFSFTTLYALFIILHSLSLVTPST